MIPAVDELERLKRDVLPALFADPSRIGEYGASVDAKVHIDELSSLMEQGAVSRLSGTIAKIITKMKDASPERIAKKPSWIERALGGDVESKARYHVARDTFESLIQEAEGQAQGVRDTIGAINTLIASHGAESAQLVLAIQAAREYLAANPAVGVPAPGAMEFDNPRERLARKVANLATLLASNELGVSQMKLSKAQAVDLLDQFDSTVSVLVPVWRQHTLTLISSKAISPTLLAQASHAHQELIKSLSLSLSENQN